ncbi:MAG: hypothetical protein PVF34_00425 [Gammaproteobacteria bacterium]|jgi:hypothetical protein
MMSVGRIAILAVILIPIGCSDFFSESKSKTQPPSETTQGPPTRGKVMNAMQGGGYTYMKLENNGETFWVASSIINVKRNDIVTWEGGSVMTEFQSYALNKQFDEIRFVTSIEVVR